MLHSCRTEERGIWMTQKALELLDFPLAEPWPEVLPMAPGPLDGRTVGFTGHEREERSVRRLLLALAADRMSWNFRGRFLVLSDLWQRALDRDARIVNGHTVELVAEEIIRYQPVIFTVRHARIQAACADGVIVEVGADDVSAWSGEDLGLATARFIGRSRD